MIKKALVYAIIPARGGSKRLHRKNIYPVMGKPMIQYAIEASQKSLYIDKVFVSSEDEEILSISSDLGAIAVKRTEENSLDHVYKQHAVVECLDSLKAAYDEPQIVLSIQANSPEILAEDLDAAIKKFVEFDRHELMSFNEDLIQNAAFRIMRHDTVYQKTLSTRCGCFVTDYIDVHTESDVAKVEQRMMNRVS